MNYPNIFTAQSKEFSQDAFIDWLLRCADPEENKDDDTRRIGGAFVQMLLKKHNEVVEKYPPVGEFKLNLRAVLLPLKIESVKIKRQRLRIDVLAKVNDDISIIFENKLATGMHDNQLARYRDELVKHRPHDVLVGVYYKVMDECDMQWMEKAYHYCTLSRSEMLHFLSAQETQNPVLLMYREYLQNIEADIQAWMEKSVADINAGTMQRSVAWGGFFSRLRAEILERSGSTPDAVCGWGWINNMAGGFYGLWLGSWSEEVPTVYVQCDEHEMKVRMSGPRSGEEMRSAWKHVCKALDCPASNDQAKRMKHNAKSAEIGNLGFYIQSTDGIHPDPKLTAEHVLDIFEITNKATAMLRGEGH